MKLLIALFLLLIVTLLFEQFPKTGDRDWWPFFDGYTLTPQWYVSIHEEFIYRFVILGALVFEVKKYKEEVFCFALLNVADWIDFILTNNTPWFWGISMNIIMITVFGFLVGRVIVREAWLS